MASIGTPSRRSWRAWPDRCRRRWSSGSTGGPAVIPSSPRELALLGADEPAQLAPSAVRDAIERRVRRLPEATQRALEVSALVGNDVYPDVVANVLDTSAASVQAACAVAVEHGVLTAASCGRARFAHDLYRETLAASVSADQRPHWHQAIGVALEARVGG